MKDGPQESDQPAIVLSGSAKDVLTDGVFTAHLEMVLHEIEGERGVKPGQLVYEFHLVIGNPRPVSLKFDSIQMKTIGEDREHTNSQQRGKPEELDEIILTENDGKRARATTPEDSVPIPKKFVVELKLRGQAVGKPLSFTISPDDIKPGPRLVAAKKAKGGELTRSGRMSYRGLSPKQSLEKAVAKALEWNAKASLRIVRGNQWEVFGDPDTKDVTGIDVPEWRYTFVAGDQARSILVSSDGVKSIDDENAVRVATQLSPLEDWEIDVEEAVKIAAKQGVKIERGPSLNMFEVGDKKIPLWVMPGAPGLLIDAKTGNVVAQKNVKNPLGERMKD